MSSQSRDELGTPAEWCPGGQFVVVVFCSFLVQQLVFCVTCVLCACLCACVLGMVIGSYFWGCLADTKGRRVVLIAALLLDGAIGILSTASQIFSLFMFFRFINGFA